MPGVGQSLYSSHLDAVYKPNHKFIDPQIWYDETEMRKQVEQAAGCFILTAQEKPENRQNAAGNYLQRSAEILGKTVIPKIAGTNNYIDKKIRLVFTGHGPEFWNLEALIQSEVVRRVRNLHYTWDFADLVYRELLLCYAKCNEALGSTYGSFVDNNNNKRACFVRNVHDRMCTCTKLLEIYFSDKAKIRIASSILRTGSELVSLLPTHTRHWWPIIEDIFTSTSVKRICADIMTEFCRSKEFEYVSIDATIKCCMSVMGQESYRASREKRNQAPFDDETALRRVLSVRGRTGALLALIPVSSERAEEVCLALATHLPAEGLRQVQCVASDNATHKLYAELRRIMPNLQCLALDPIHLCIVYEKLIQAEHFFYNSMVVLIMTARSTQYFRTTLCSSGMRPGERRHQEQFFCERSCASLTWWTMHLLRTIGIYFTQGTMCAV